MSTNAPKPHLRYAELREWLSNNGVSHYKLRSLISQGVIKTSYVGGGTAYYNADQVKRDVLDALDSAEVSR
jgi:predicted transcriptional regulator